MLLILPRVADSVEYSVYQQNTQAAGVLQRRAELEESESSSSSSNQSRPRNCVSAANLSTLLDARKEIKSLAEFTKLCNDFNCDVEVVQKLGKYFTSPSLTLQRTKQQEKDETYIVSNEIPCRDFQS